MSHFVADLVGFTNLRAKEVVPYLSVTRGAIVSAIVDTLTSCGWTKLSGPTSTTFGDEYKLYSAQSPWYDHDNPPSWYLGGRALLYITHPNSTNIFMRFGEYYNGGEEELSSASEGITISPAAYGANTGDFFILGNPYECYVGIRLATAPSGTEFYLGALNVPGPVQEDQEVISSIIADRFRITAGSLIGSSAVYSLWRTTSGATKWFGNPGSTRASCFLTVRGPVIPTGNFSHQSGRRLWRRDRDLGQSDPTLWEPFVLPAQVALPITSSSGTPQWRGFMWDAMIIPENATQGSYLDFIDKAWFCYASGKNTTDSYPGSLWINIGEEGEEL